MKEFVVIARKNGNVIFKGAYDTISEAVAYADILNNICDEGLYYDWKYSKDFKHLF